MPNKNFIIAGLAGFLIAAALFVISLEAPSSQKQEIWNWIKTVERADFKEYIESNGINLRYEDDATLLHLAVYSKREDLIRILLMKGANPNKLDQYFGDSPLKSAVYLSDEIFELLLKAGADPNLRRNQRATPLMSAALRGEKRKVELLVEYGADLDLKDERGSSAIFYAVGINREEIIGYLIDEGADLNFINAEGRSVLGKVLVHGHLKTLECICSKENGLISRAVYGRFFEKLSMNHLTPDQIKVLQLCGSKTL